MADSERSRSVEPYRKSMGKGVVAEIIESPASWNGDDYPLAARVVIDNTGSPATRVYGGMPKVVGPIPMLANLPQEHDFEVGDEVTVFMESISGHNRVFFGIEKPSKESTQ